MRDLTEYVCKAMDMLDSIGVKYGNIIDCTVNTRAQKRWGSMQKSSRRLYNQYQCCPS